MTYVQIRGLSKRFGDVQAIDSLNLEVRQGELLSLLGPSGCGKTTALRILAGFEVADEGDIIVDGRPINRVPASRRNMGMVFQAYSLFPTMTARENIEFGLRVRGVAKAARSEKARDLLSLVQLRDRGDNYPHQLSGGEQQRVALARALAFEPSVLLLDEPLSALDAKVRVTVREEIRRIQSRLGITAVYVTHDQEEAFSISDRVAVMASGRLQQIGKPVEIYQNPENLFVAGFVGTVNRLPGQAVGGSKVAIGSRPVTIDVAEAGLADGDKVIALIRPEGIQVRSREDSSNRNHLDGQVRAQTFLGAVTRLRIETAAGDLLADVASGRALQLVPDTQVAVSIDPAVIRVMPEQLADDIVPDV